jgi:hypothetical protein
LWRYDQTKLDTIGKSQSNDLARPQDEISGGGPEERQSSRLREPGFARTTRREDDKFVKAIFT